MLKFECPNCQHVFIEKDVKPYNKGYFGGIWLCPRCEAQLSSHKKSVVLKHFNYMIYAIAAMQLINLARIFLEDTQYAWLEHYFVKLILLSICAMLWHMVKWWPISRKIKRGEIIVKLDKWQDS